MLELDIVTFPLSERMLRDDVADSDVVAEIDEELPVMLSRAVPLGVSEKD